MRMVDCLVVTSKPSLKLVCKKLLNKREILDDAFFIDQYGDTTVIEREDGFFGDDVTSKFVAELLSFAGSC